MVLLNAGASKVLDEDYKRIVDSARSLRLKPEVATYSQDSFAVGDCPLCKIGKGEVRARIVHQSPEFLAFLDIAPKAAGHVAVISRRHSRDFESLTDVERSTYADFVAEISSRMKSKLGATGYVVVSPVGQSAGHVTDHFVSHIIPTYGRGPDLPIMNILQPQKVPDFVMDDVRQKMTTISAIAEGNRIKRDTP